MRRLLKLGALAALALYLGGLAVLAASQRDLMYFPKPLSVNPLDAGFIAKPLVLKTSDGERLTAWHRPAQKGKPTILYFYGNAGLLANHIERFNALAADGSGLFSIDYRGYGASSGKPTEAGLLLDAEAAYLYLLAESILPQDVIVYGESLGGGVAAAIAAQHHPGALILESTFSSALDVASARFPIFPVGFVMRDTFRSDLRIKDLQAPLLMLHGDADTVVPLRFGEKLFALAAEPKMFIRVPGAAHLVLMNKGVLEQVRDWIARTKRGV